MKTSLVSLIIIASCIGLSGVSFAEKASSAAVNPAESNIKILAGKIVNIDTAKNEITIQEKNGAKDSFMVDHKQISSLKTNEWVKVTL